MGCHLFQLGVKFENKFAKKKSEIILVEETEDVNRVASLFGCKVGKLPTSNLGLPLGPPKKHCGVWNSIE